LNLPAEAGGYGRLREFLCGGGRGFESVGTVSVRDRASCGAENQVFQPKTSAYREMKSPEGRSCVSCSVDRTFATGETVKPYLTGTTVVVVLPYESTPVGISSDIASNDELSHTTGSRTPSTFGIVFVRFGTGRNPLSSQA